MNYLSNLTAIIENSLYPLYWNYHMYYKYYTEAYLTNQENKVLIC